MRETIIFAPGANEAELLRSLARFGVKTLGYRVYGAVDFARAALQITGTSVTQTFLPRKDEPTLIDSFLREIPYFKNASFADAESMAAALYLLRSLIPDNESRILHDKLTKGEFPEKNRAILQVYDRYIKEVDAAERIDTIGLIRKVLLKTMELDADILTLKEYPLSPIERELANKLSGGSCREITLPDLFHAVPSGTPEMTITEGYGASNEVRDILHFIFSNHIPLDRCTVAVTEAASYAKLFSDLSDEYEIPVTFGCGLPITLTNPARLLKLYQTWNTSGYRGTDALISLVMSSAFDRGRLQSLLPEKQEFGTDTWTEILKTAGALRLSANRETNAKRIREFLDSIRSEAAGSGRQQDLRRYAASCLAAIASEMEKGPSYLIETYTRIREGRAGRLDRSAVQVITGMISAFRRYSGKDDIDEIIPAILNKTVSSENSREGSLHVCGIRGAMTAAREYLFVAGLSASYFPGSPAENYLLLDSDLEMFGTGKDIPVSSVRVYRNRQSLYDLLHLAEALALKVRLSYASYDLAELKDANPSSVLQEIFSMKNPDRADDGAFEKALCHAGFFDDGISVHANVGEAYKEGNVIAGNGAAAGQQQSVPWSLDQEYSPSEIDMFFGCPKRFYLTRILRIEEPETDDPFEVIRASQTGTLAHTLMAELGASHMDKESFLQRAQETFTVFLKSRPPVHEDDAHRELRQFVSMMGNAWDQDPKREVLLAEEKQHVIHPSGVKLKGIPDRVEKTEDGSCRIIDFKTGRRIMHQEDDAASCLQVLAYAFMMEQAGYEISGCEYRYLRNKRTIPCRYDAELKEALADRLTVFKNALLSGDFPCTEDEDQCKYCSLSMVCGREQKKEGEGGSDE